MPQNPEHPPVTVEMEPTLEEIYTRGMSAIELLAANPDHPHANLALHVFDLYVAASRVVGLSEAGVLNMAEWNRPIQHRCEEHVFAAVYLIAMGRKDGNAGACDVLRDGHTIIAELLDS